MVRSHPSRRNVTPTKETIMTAIQTIRVSDLRIDEKANVRKHGRGVDPEFVASIAALGVIEPLIVRPNGKGFVVTEGGKRLAACQHLIAKKELPEDYAVDCIVINPANDAEAREISLATNIIRASTHPVDQFRAFAQLHKDRTRPLDVEAIGARFGLPRKQVEQRLALGALDDKILDAWAADDLTAEAAMAFTLCPDKKAQVTIFDKLRK